MDFLLHTFLVGMGAILLTLFGAPAVGVVITVYREVWRGA